MKINKFDLIINKKENRHTFRDEYDYYKFLARRYLLDDKSYKKHEICNIILNALIVVVLFTLFLLSKITLTTLLFMLPITYIAYDCLGLVLNRIAGYVHLKLVQISERKKNEEFSKLPEKEQEKLLKKIRNQRYDIDDEDYGAYSLLSAKIETYKNIMENFKSVDEEMEEILESKNLSDIERAKNSIEELEKYKKDCPKGLVTKYNQIIEKSEDLLQVATEKPSLMDKLNKTYNIYLKELIKLLDSYNDLTEEEQKEYKEILKTVMIHFLEHLDDLETCLSAETKMSFDIASSVLLDNLKKEKNNV